VAEQVIPADAETALIRHLAARMPIDVRGFRLGAPAHRQIQVRKTGGTTVDPAVDMAQLTVHVWGESTDDEQPTERLASKAVVWLRLADRAGFLDYVPMRNLRVLSTPYANPDPLTGRARYTFTIAVDLRGTPTNEE